MDAVETISSLDDDDLLSMHNRLDAKGLTESVNVQTHHLVTAELLKRGLPHGHTDDDWARAAILVDEVFVKSVDELDIEEPFREILADSLSAGGKVSIFLTADGYFLKSDPTVSDVHVNTIARKPKRLEKTIYEENGEFTVYSADGKRRFGTYATRREAEERLRQIERFAKAESGFVIPAGVRAAAKQALEWIAAGKAGSGFTSVGRGRARQLASGENVSRETLVKMRAYFARHAVDKKAEGWGNKSKPTPGMVAWYAWGGDAGRTWANDVLGRVEKRSMPLAIYDLALNTTNRQHAIDEHRYGPMNPDHPGAYWARLAEVWNVSPEVAATTRCGSCAAFNQSPEILQAMADAIGDAGSSVVDAADLGYCELFEFKCSAARTCDAWIAGGPIAKHAKHDQKSHGRRYSVSNRVSDEILSRVKNEGGLSISMLDGSEPPDGFMVALTKGVKPAIVDASEFFDRDSGRSALRSFFKDNAQVLTGGSYLGLWHDTSSDKVFLDISENVPDRSTAERLGRERDQISIWDVVQGEEVPTGGSGKIEKSDSDDQVTGHFKHDGRRDRRFRGRDLRSVDGEDGKVVNKHGQPGRDKDYHRKHPGGAKANLPPVEDKKASAERSPDAVAAARELREKIAAVEPELTSRMLSLAEETGGEMIGLAFRLKSEDSLARKIDSEKDEHGSAKKAADAMNDVVRYTLQLPEEGYVAGATTALKDFEEAGFETTVKNYWEPGDPYQGINVAVAHPDGYRFELQFHTEDSWAAKDEIHLLYEDFRTESDDATRWDIYRQMTSKANKLPVPSGDIFSIGELRRQPFA